MSTHAHTHEGPSEHGHGHGRGHEHRHAATVEGRREDRRRLWIALGLTLGIAVAEGVGGFVSNSMALLSDALHLMTDVAALGLSLLALWFGTRPANVKKSYGYYRLEILGALANGVLLLAVTFWVAVEAVHRLRHPEPVVLKTMAIIAAFGLVSNVTSLFFLHRTRSMGVRAVFLHILGDALASLGVLAAAAIMWRTGWMFLDPLVSLFIAVVIVAGAYRLLRDAVDVLLEAVPGHVDLGAVRELMAKVSGVRAVHDLHVWTLSSGMYALSAHLVVADPMVCNNDQILSAVKHELFERYGIDHTTIQIESETFAHLGEVH